MSCDNVLSTSGSTTRRAPTCSGTTSRARWRGTASGASSRPAAFRFCDAFSGKEKGVSLL
eukprot:3567873-Rhodomonas_salina.3